MDFQGQVIQDRYVVGEMVGEGADAVVHRARDRRLDRVVAVKFLRPALRADPTFVTRFEREARSAASLDHPHIVPVYDYGEGAGTFFLVMQLLLGGDLRRRLRPGQPLIVDEAVRLAIEVADALGAAHARGIVHRDVKPGNILLTADEHVKVSDFGIAKMLDAPALTMRAALLGSAYYMAPEQASAGAITPAADVYSLGVVLFEMLAGRPPFDGETFLQVALRHLQTPPPSIEELNPAVPVDLAEIVAWALAKDPAQRFADGSAFATALREQQGLLEPIAAFPSPRPPLAAPPEHVAAPDGALIVPADEAATEPHAGGEPTATLVSGLPERAGWLSEAAPSAAAASSGPVAADGPQPVASEPGDAVGGSEPVLPATGPRPPADAAWAPAGSAAFPAVEAEEPVHRKPESAWRPPQPQDTSYLPILVVLLCGMLVAALIVGGLLFANRGPARAAPDATAIGSSWPTTEAAGSAVEATTEPNESSAAEEDAGAGSAPAAATAESSPAATSAATPGPTPRPAATAAPTSAPAGAPAAAAAPAAPAAPGHEVVLDDDAFQGGYSAPRTYRGRTARWLYGARSQYGEMTAHFDVEGTPGAGQLVITGIDSENGPKTPIAVLVNDTVIYQGGNPLPKDDWRGPVAPWGDATLPIPKGVLHAGANSLTFKNLAPVDNFGVPPYFMLDQAVITY